MFRTEAASPSPPLCRSSSSARRTTNTTTSCRKRRKKRRKGRKGRQRNEKKSSSTRRKRRGAAERSTSSRSRRRKWRNKERVDRPCWFTRMYHYRFSNTVIGYLNLLTLLASIPIIGGGLWVARGSATCERFLQTPLLVIGFVVLLVSLAGFVGACFNVAWALWLYLCVMVLLIAALLGLTVFGFVVTSRGGGVQVPGRLYREYRLADYHPWLRARIADPNNWRAVRGCLVSSKACPKIAAWTPLDYMEHTLSPVQSGCCKPPTSCQYGEGISMAAQDADCYRWSNSAGELCYECDSCRAGVLEQVRRDWQKVSVLNVVVLAILVGVTSIGCCAFRNARRSDTYYPYGGQNRMSKVRPRWDYYWWRWWYDRNAQLY